MIKKLLPQSDFSRNVLTLVSGTAMAQFITLAFSPFLARLYTPEEYGIFTIFVSIFSAIAVVSTARYEFAIMLPDKDEDAVNLLALSVLISFLIGLATLFVVLPLQFLTTCHIRHELKLMLYFLPLFVFLLGTSQAFNNWFNRKKEYPVLARSRVANSFSNNGLAFVTGILNFRAWGLFLSNLFGQVILSFVLAWTFFKNHKGLISQVSKSNIRQQAIRYKVFPQTSTFQALVEMFQVNGIIYLLPIFFSSTTVGFYSRTLIVMQAPISLIGAAMAQVFYQKATEVYQKDKNELLSLYKGTLVKSAVLALPILISLLFWGPQLFAFVFGEQWRESGIYAQLLAPWIFFDFIRVTISQVANVIGIQKRIFALSLIGTFILVFSISFAGLGAKNIFTGLTILSIAMSFYILILLIVIYHSVKDKTK